MFVNELIHKLEEIRDQNRNGGSFRVYVGSKHEHVFTPNHFCVVCGATNG
ncbi:hypothetical protein LCGC14_0264170 [marine sediment metagenome]|uniref:Uncharacterized protein n=1 Tax=marine sediment metagenome TaxID=412755 RepID=A0A0F9X5N4_9ZZZZ